MKSKYINALVRTTLLLVLILGATVSAAAQSTLAVGSLFDGRYRNRPDATETVISGEALKEYNLSVFRSITLTGSDTGWQEIEKMVRRDGRDAVSKEEKIVNGRMLGAFYELPSQNGRHRYLCYLNRILNGGDKVMIIYLEGKAGLKEVRELL